MGAAAAAAYEDAMGPAWVEPQEEGAEEVAAASSQPALLAVAESVELGGLPQAARREPAAQEMMPMVPVDQWPLHLHSLND